MLGVSPGKTGLHGGCATCIELRMAFCWGCYRVKRGYTGDVPLVLN